MRSKIFPIILIAATIGLAFYAYPIIKGRYFQTKEVRLDASSEPSSNASAPISAETPANADENNVPGNEETIIDNQPVAPTTNVFSVIAKEDCDSECKNFIGDKRDYCNEVCGFKTINENVAGCENLNGLQKDYCLKDLGITKKDFKICENISDSNIKSTCKNRIMEDNVDDVMSNGNIPS